MKENVVDVLVFLFDNYLCAEASVCESEQSLAIELEEAGFESGEISKAFDWLGALRSSETELPAWKLSEPKSFRAYTTEEQQRLEPESRGFLLSLEQIGMIDAYTREVVLDAVMNLDVAELSIKAFKRIVGLILLNLPLSDDKIAWVEDFVYEQNEVAVLH